MKHTSKKTLLLLLALLLLASLFPTAALAELSGGAVYYLDASGSIKTCSCTPVTASAVEWSGGWYAVSENVTISGQVTVSGTVNLVLLDGCTLTVNSDSYGISVSESAALNIYAGSTGGTVRGTGALSGRIENDGPVTVNGGTVNASGEIGISSWNVFTVNGGTVNAHGAQSSGMFGGGGWGISNEGSFTVNGGTVNASGSICGFDNYGTLTVGSGVSLYGGNDASSATFLVKGEKVYSSNYDELAYPYMTIVAPNPVASVTSGGTTTKYADLSTALSALPANGTLKLLADVTTSEHYTLDKTCTVDLNGHMLTGASDGDFITVQSGTVTFTDTSASPGTIAAQPVTTSASAIEVSESGSVIVNNGINITATWHGVHQGASGTGDITINNAVIAAPYPIHTGGPAVTTINGGVFTASAYFARSDSDGGTTIINGGTFNGPYHCWAGTLQINGGVFNDRVTKGDRAEASFVINGGTFNGYVNDDPSSGVPIEIYGGLFRNKPDDYLLAAFGKVFAYDGEYWQVVDSTDPVCTVGSLYYLNLSEALSNWTAGSTLTLLKDVTTASTITVPSGAHTLDLNGHGLRMTGSGSVISVPSGAVLTLNDSSPSVAHSYSLSGYLATVGSGDYSFTGGYITGGSTSGEGGGVHVDGTFTMYGGTIIGNSASKGGGVCVDTGASMAMSGGAIRYNVGIYKSGDITVNGDGGGIVVYGSLNMSGGRVCDNHSGWGGGIEARGGSAFILSGGTITGNSVEDAYDSGGASIQYPAKGGGVLIYNTATFQLSGSPVINGNELNDLYLDSHAVCAVVGALGSSVSIPVTMAAPGVFTDSANTSYNDASKFTSDDANYRVLANADGQLMLHAVYTVTLTGGANAAVSGDTTQSDLTGAMETVSYTANTGYHFAQFDDESGSGVTTHWVDATHVTVSGTPEADVEITVPAAVINTYTVTWMNGDAAVETDTDVPYGSDASYNGETPEKEQDADYTYTFAGWTPAPETVTADATYTATFTAVPKYAYQLYYLLDSATDTDGDIYMDYDAGATVTATIYLKNTTGEDMTLQAFDLYVTNDAKLTYAGFTPASGSSAVRVESGTSASDATTQHIQLIGAKDGDGYTSPGVTLTNGAAVALGTLSFTIDSDAVYNTGLPIAIIGGDNTRKANIAVANDQNSYYPTVTAPVLGAEVMTTYSVTYMDSLDALSIEPETKGYNTAYTVKYTTNSEWASVSVPTGRVFLGWAESENGDVAYALGEDAAEIAANVNAPVTLYAVWGYTRHTVTYTGVGVTEESSTHDYGTAFPAYSGGTPAKEATVSTVYSFAGWDMNNDGTADTLPATVTEDVTLVSVFTASVRTYTVSFDVGAGSVTNAPAAQTVAYNGHAARPATNPSLANFVFMGWYTTDQYTETFDFDSTAITGDTTVYAKWIDASYTVTLEENGGSYVAPYVEPTRYDYGTGLTLPTAANIQKTGYSFGGWYADSGFSGEAVTAIGITDAGDKTFYAKWTPITYQVRFNPNNGSSSMANQTFTYDEAQSLNDTAFTRANYSFKGWTTAANPATNAAIDYADKASVTNLASTQGAVVELYAVWTLDPLTITYEAGENATNPNTTTTYTVEGENVVFTAPARPGYSFASWTAKKTGTNETVELTGGNTLPVSTAANVTLTANWNPVSYTITYAGEGTLPDNKTYTIETNDYTLPTPTRDGYTFGGWKATTVAAESNWELNNVYAADAAVTGKYGDVTLTAQWTATEYTVSFDENGGDTLTDLPYTVTSTDTLATPTRTGYTFAGWKISTTAGNWAAVDTILDNSAGSNTFALSGNYGNVELQAQWTPVSYSIGYTLDGGTVDTANPTTYTIETATFTLNNPTRIGYTFKGWSGTDLTGDENTAVSIAQGSTGDRAYTANWTANTYHVKFYQYPEGTAGENPVVTYGDQTYTVENTGITVPAVPVMNGYDGAWSSYSIDTATPADIDVYPVYTPHSYTITFVPNGGADIAVDAGSGITALNTMTYNIESTYTLPTTTNGLYSFKGWKVATADGNWTADALFSPDGTSGDMPAVTGKYGDVTLTAQWEFEIGHVVDEYKYAYTGWRMLRIDASGLGEKESYAYDGELMYYTDDENYRLNGKPVYYTLIPASSDTLTADQIALITVQNHVVTPRSINYTGDVNGDKAINIADANIVFQMLASGSAGGYYTVSQLSTAERLAADMEKGTENADHRGSIADVSSIVTAINNGTSSTSDDVFTEATVEISGTAQGATGNLPGTNDPPIPGFVG